MINSFRPVTIEAAWLGKPTNICSVTQAAEFLLIKWPRHDGPKLQIARQICFEALEGKASAADTHSALSAPVLLGRRLRKLVVLELLTAVLTTVLRWESRKHSDPLRSRVREIRTLGLLIFTVANYIPLSVLSCKTLPAANSLRRTMRDHDFQVAMSSGSPRDG
jgi:hypothetical protein